MRFHLALYGDDITDEDPAAVIAATLDCDVDEVELYELEDVDDYDNLSEDGLYCVVPLDPHIYTVSGLLRNLQQDIGGMGTASSISAGTVADIAAMLQLAESYRAKAQAMKDMTNLVISQLLTIQRHLEANAVDLATVFKASDISRTLERLHTEEAFSAAKREEHHARLANLIRTDIREYDALMDRFLQYRTYLQSLEGAD
ncbi:hypothetical protein GMRT_13975 [Giardia muris]|uniref:Uncharacterized protein n=1 Tax=Giardia muris TaxID=5742 RepID=A0A4Z1SUR7_GIAMU|nr:hypothetical protein GMRT_13975 [Giardia muris]|eukprot:TNJ29586.1 hypothetical protein GMRT_13975 [Giardia muris]